MFSEHDEHWMRHAIMLAEKAKALNEVPVGAVLVLNNELIAEGWNQPISAIDPTAHAEIVALRAAAQVLQNYRLVNTTLYVTLEPCMMCRGAMMHARVERVVFGAFDKRIEKCNHHAGFVGGLLAEPCGKMLSEFFLERR